MKQKVTLIYLLLFSVFAFSQQVKVTGTIKDNSGYPLPGVNIVEDGTQNGVTSDFDGKFSISANKGSILTFTYVGFKTQTITVDKSVNLDLVLTDDVAKLDEIVAIGYGSQTKKEVTGAVSVISAKTIEDLKPIKVEQALQGTVSGVNVTSSSGAPGAGINIRIRGIATNGANGPTAIIDGYVGDISLLNPNDIESITVLKDAQAAIYGVIGANGIVLVTTKQGRKNQKPKVSYNTYSGFQSANRQLSMLNATEYALLLNEAYANGGQAIPFPNVTGLGEGTDWQKEVLQKGAPIINHDFSISGGSEKTTYSISGSHIDQDGIVGLNKSGFLRNTARIGLGVDLSDKLKLSSNAIYTQFDRQNLNEGGLGSVLFNALNAPTTLKPFDANGEYTLIPSSPGFGIEVINPLAQIENTYNSYNYKKLNGTVGLEYNVFDYLKVKTQMGFNTSNSKGKSFNKEISYGGKVFDVAQSSVNQNTVNDNNYSFDTFIEYDRSLNNTHNFNLTLGQSVFKEWGNGLFATGYDVPNNSWDFADIGLTTGALEVKQNGSYAYDERRLSYFGRLQYDFKQKYLFSAMLRKDASTKFGPNNASAVFPSFTSGWVVSDENFLKDSEKINFFKLRASYGLLGNDQIGNNGYVGQLNGEGEYVFGDALNIGIAQGILPNPDLRWEQSEKIDIGADFKLFNNNLSFTTDYFINTRKDLLIRNIPVSGITGIAAPGAGAPTINAGTVRNSGWEFDISYRNKETSNFKYSLNYNVTLLQNKVLEVNNQTGFIEGGSFGVGQPAPARMQEGFALGYFYGYKTDGIFQNDAEVAAHPSQLALGAEATPGDIRFVDVNGDGVINSDDRTDLGSAIPVATMGFNIQLEYKNFDFSAYSFASVGNEMVRNYERNLSDLNKLSYTLDRWTGEGTSNTVPKVTTAATSNGVFSDYFVEDASFIRLQTVQLGYSLNSKFLEKLKIQKIRMYAMANNLVTLTKYRGFDPAASSGDPIGGGIDYGFYPQARTLILGLNVNF